MKQYKIFNDGEGHKYLIPPCDWEAVLNLSMIGDEDTLADVLSTYDTLEGQEYVVILESDLEI